MFNALKVRFPPFLFLSLSPSLSLSLGVILSLSPRVVGVGSRVLGAAAWRRGGMSATVRFMAAKGPSGLPLDLLETVSLPRACGGLATRSDKTMRDGVPRRSRRVANVLVPLPIPNPFHGSRPAVAAMSAEWQMRQMDSRAVFHILADSTW
jgi:hypothetical protein